jgi:hypothetical protein
MIILSSLIDVVASVLARAWKRAGSARAIPLNLLQKKTILKTIAAKWALPRVERAKNRLNH